MSKLDSFKFHFQSFVSGRSKFLITRVFVRFTLFSNIIYIFFILFSKAVSTENEGLLKFFIFRVTFILFAFFINWARYNPRYYFPSLREMSDSDYWFFVMIIVFLIRLPFSNVFFSIERTPLKTMLHFSLTIIYILILLLSFQSKQWTHENETKKNKRIKQLRIKAKISKTQFENLKPILFESAKIKIKQPFSWKIAKFLFSLILAIIISDSADKLVDIFANKFDIFNNIFPPF